MSQVHGATISYHLSILKKAGLVQESRIRNYIYYELNTSVLEEIMVWLSDLQRRSGTEENGTGAVDFPEIQKNGNEASSV